jgi:hypothetical protein
MRSIDVEEELSTLLCNLRSARWNIGQRGKHAGARGALEAIQEKIGRSSIKRGLCCLRILPKPAEKLRSGRGILRIHDLLHHWQKRGSYAIGSTELLRGKRFL